MKSKSVKLEILAEPLRSYIDGSKPLPPNSALITFQMAYLQETKLNRRKDFTHYSQLLDAVIEKKNS